MSDTTGFDAGTHPKGYAISRDRSSKRLLPWHPRASFRIVSANKSTARSIFFVTISMFTAKFISAQNPLLGTLNVGPRTGDGEQDEPDTIGASILFGR